jgi:hypothetical protein
VNWGRGLFRLWVIFSALWIAICAAIVVIEARLLDPTKTYEIEGRSKERYDVVAPASATELEAVAFAEKNRRTDCTEGKTGPWCSYPVKLYMPHNPIDWFFVYLGLGLPVMVLILGVGLSWAFSGFRRAS